MSETVEHLRDLLADFGAVSCRRMFGGWGVFRDGAMFALVVDEAVYLKADNDSRHRFSERGLPAFSYLRQGRAVSLSYYPAPEEALDDPRAMRPWAELAYAAARRSQTSASGR